MTRRAVVNMAKGLGWKPWGKLRPYKNGSKYQCFRRGKYYAWIGNFFIESNCSMFAQDFVNYPPERVRLFLT
jgi:hypothetical protein